MKTRVKIEDLVKEMFRELSKKPPHKRVVRLVLDDKIDYSVNRHPIEKPLQEAGIVYYFDKDGQRIDGAYEVNLNGLEIIYINTSSQQYP